MIRAFITCVTLFVAVPAWAEIKIKEVTSPGGINAWLVEEPSIPFVALEIRFKGGTSLDAEGTRGATNLMVGLLQEGTGDMDAQAFAKASEGEYRNKKKRKSRPPVRTPRVENMPPIVAAVDTQETVELVAAADREHRSNMSFIGEAEGG